MDEIIKTIDALVAQCDGLENIFDYSCLVL